jgi:hypothetical protein
VAGRYASHLKSFLISEKWISTTKDFGHSLDHFRLSKQLSRQTGFGEGLEKGEMLVEGKYRSFGVPMRSFI